MLTAAHHHQSQLANCCARLAGLAAIGGRSQPLKALLRSPLQLYGNYKAMQELRAAVAGRNIGLTPGQLDAFLWPGWAPCLFARQNSYPPTE